MFNNFNNVFVNFILLTRLIIIEVFINVIILGFFILLKSFILYRIKFEIVNNNRGFFIINLINYILLT